MITLDCETEAIVGNPIAHPPAMHGLAYDIPGHPPGYLHFRTERANTKYSIVGDFLQNIWDSGEPLLFHNAPFDLSVICSTFNLPMPSWDRIHDTMYLVYLADPYAPTLSLKPSAERYLGLPPQEQDELTDWIVKNVPEATRKTAGAYIVRAPVQLIAPYAIGDVERTRQLFDKLYPTQPREAYDRERRLMPTLFDASRRGLRVHRAGLEQLLERSETVLDAADNRVRALLAAPGLEVSSGPALADALESAGMVDQWILTPKGERSVAKENLAKVITNQEVLNLLRYRSSLETCITTFMRPWLILSAEDGRLHPEWNQVRTNEDGKRYGTRTGRLSCSNPNLQNVPTEFDQEIPEGLPPLPFMRQFLLPEEGHIWLKRDFSSQEIRIAAHFEDGPLLEAYQANPELDPHQMAKDLILEMLHKDFPRKHVKITGFQIIYGGGKNAIASNVGCSIAEAQDFKDSYFTAMPGIRELSYATSRRGRAGEPIKTWGGRLYYREISPKYPTRDFSYKLLNYLIQGSASDQTKECINRWADDSPQATFLATVHDEINICCPPEIAEEEMARLRKHMEADLFDCPMRSEGFIGDNWHDLEECK